MSKLKLVLTTVFAISSPQSTSGEPILIDPPESKELTPQTKISVIPEALPLQFLGISLRISPVILKDKFEIGNYSIVYRNVKQARFYNLLSGTIKEINCDELKELFKNNVLMLIDPKFKLIQNNINRQHNEFKRAMDAINCEIEYI